MKKILSLLLAAALIGLPALFSPAPARADNKENDEDRLENAGQVMKEIIEYPRRYPAEPARQGRLRDRDSFGAQGRIHRRRQLRPRRHDLPQRRRLSRPLGRSHDDGARRRQLRISARRPGHRLRAAGDERARRQLHSQQQSEAGRRCFRRGRSRGPRCRSGYGRDAARRSAHLFPRARAFSPASRWRARRCVRTTMPTSASTARSSTRRKSRCTARFRFRLGETADRNAQSTQPEEPFEVTLSRYPRRRAILRRGNRSTISILRVFSLSLGIDFRSNMTYSHIWLLGHREYMSMASSTPLSARVLRVAGRRERHRAEIRERLFRAALRLFAERGFLETTVEDITEAADVGKGTFFNYFPTKEHVLATFGAERIAAIERALERSAKQGACAAGAAGYWRPILAGQSAESPALLRAIYAAHAPCAPVRAELQKRLHAGRRLDGGNFCDRAGARRSPARSFGRGFRAADAARSFGVTLAWAMNPDSSARPPRRCGICSLPALRADEKRRTAKSQRRSKS